MENELEQLKNQCSDAAAQAFAHDLIDLPTFEAISTDIVSAKSRHAIQAIQRSLTELGAPGSEAPEFARGAALPRSMKAIEVNMGSVKKSGTWLQGQSLSIFASMSTVVLDLTEYRNARMPDLHFDLDCGYSTVKILVPDNFEVYEQLASQKMSSFSERGPRTGGGVRVFLGGKINGCSLHIRHYPLRPRGFFARLRDFIRKLET